MLVAFVISGHDPATPLTQPRPLRAGHLSERGGTTEVPMLATRDRAEVLAELARLTHQAGRMTVRDERYAGLHRRIDALLVELETCDSR